MCIVPSIVVNQSCSVGKTCDLVSIIPPAHDNWVRFCVHPQPIVCLPVVINYEFLTVMDWRKHYRWWWVGLGSWHHPVVYKCTAEIWDKDDEEDGNIPRNRFLTLLFAFCQFLGIFRPLESLNTFFIEPTDTNSRTDTSSWCKNKQQPDHNRCEIHWQYCINSYENDIVIPVFVDVVKSNRCKEDCEVDVEEEWRPGCCLMFWYTCHDWDVFFGVGWVE